MAPTRSKAADFKEFPALVEDILSAEGVNKHDLMIGPGPMSSQRLFLISKSAFIYVTPEKDAKEYYDRALLAQEHGGSKVVVIAAESAFTAIEAVPEPKSNIIYKSSPRTEIRDYLKKFLLNEQLRLSPNVFHDETEFDVMVNRVRDLLVEIFDKGQIRLNKRVQNRFADIAVITTSEKFPDEPRPIICIEVKKESTSGLGVVFDRGRITEDLKLSVKQALAYSLANHYVRHDIELRPVCILTDGKFGAVLDPSKTAEQNLSLLATKGTRNLFRWEPVELKRKLNPLSDSSVENLLTKSSAFGSSVNYPLICTVGERRVEETCDKRLAQNLHRCFNTIEEHVGDDRVSIDYTMQIFLMAILRNCGFITVQEIDHHLLHLNDRAWLQRALSRWFTANFLKVHNDHLDVFLKAYQLSRLFDVRVDAMPQEELGYAYETFIKKANKTKATEFYTPDVLIRAVLDEVQPQKTDIIFDPTCGCGSFLVAAVRRIFPQGLRSKSEIKQISKFLASNVFGNDRDMYAVNIAKASLLSLFVERLGADPTEMPNLDLPVVKDSVFEKDFFDFSWPTSKPKPTLIIGNAPWGDVSKNCDNFEEVVGHKDNWQKIQKIRGEFSSEDRHEISGTVVLKLVDMFVGRKDVRLGMLIKQQILVKGKDTFLRDPRTSAFSFFDYGPRQLFAHTGALTAIAYYSSKKDGKRAVVSKFDLPYINVLNGTGMNANDLYITKGSEMGRNKIWVDLASKKSLQHLCVNLLDTDPDELPLKRPKTMKAVYLAPPGQVQKLAKKDPASMAEYKRDHDLISSELSPAQRRELLSVTTGSAKTDENGIVEKKTNKDKKFQFHWRRPVNADFLTKSWKLIVPLYFVGGRERLPVLLTNRAIVPKTSFYVILPDAERASDLKTQRALVNISAWMSSKYFKYHLEGLARQGLVKRATGGFELAADYLGRIDFPEALTDSEEIEDFVVLQIIGKTVTEDVLRQLDSLIERIVFDEVSVESFDRAA